MYYYLIRMLIEELLAPKTTDVCSCAFNPQIHDFAGLAMFLGFDRRIEIAY